LQKPSVSLVAIPIANPYLIGIYENKKLIKKLELTGKTSEILPKVFRELEQEFEIKRVIYAKGPGSYMSIKLSYIFFKTLEITKNIEFLAQDGFYFNNNSPIKAIGKNYFVKKEDIITLEKDKKEGVFKLPEYLNIKDFTIDTKPLYLLNAV